MFAQKASDPLLQTHDIIGLVCDGTPKKVALNICRQVVPHIDRRRAKAFKDLTLRLEQVAAVKSQSQGR